MRDLANSAARSAIEQHIRKHTGKQAAGKLFSAFLTLIASVVLAFAAWKIHSIEAGVAAGLGAFMGVRWTLVALRRIFTVMRLNRPQQQ
jgi:hypothetical protein